MEQNKYEVCVLQQPFTACVPREFDRSIKEQSLAASPPQAGVEGGKKVAGCFYYEAL
jgi:hypothetical protein